MQLTITEALAEIKVIDKRIQSKMEFVKLYQLRPEDQKDPLEKNGGPGSEVAVRRARQSINDLFERKILIRNLIHKANLENQITIEEETRSISDWLTWKREVADIKQAFLTQLSTKASSMMELRRVGPEGKLQSTVVVHNINLEELSKEMEKVNVILEKLDGQLSLKNATINIALSEMTE